MIAPVAPSRVTLFPPAQTPVVARRPSLQPASLFTLVSSAASIYQSVGAARRLVTREETRDDFFLFVSGVYTLFTLVLIRSESRGIRSLLIGGGYALNLFGLYEGIRSSSDWSSAASQLLIFTTLSALPAVGTVLGNRVAALGSWEGNVRIGSPGRETVARQIKDVRAKLRWDRDIGFSGDSLDDIEQQGLYVIYDRSGISNRLKVVMEDGVYAVDRSCTTHTRLTHLDKKRLVSLADRDDEVFISRSILEKSRYGELAVMRRGRTYEWDGSGFRDEWGNSLESENRGIHTVVGHRVRPAIDGRDALQKTVLVSCRGQHWRLERFGDDLFLMKPMRLPYRRPFLVAYDDRTRSLRYASGVHFPPGRRRYFFCDGRRYTVRFSSPTAEGALYHGKIPSEARSVYVMQSRDGSCWLMREALNSGGDYLSYQGGEYVVKWRDREVVYALRGNGRQEWSGGFSDNWFVGRPVRSLQDADLTVYQPLTPAEIERKFAFKLETLGRFIDGPTLPIDKVPRPQSIRVVSEVPFDLHGQGLTASGRRLKMTRYDCQTDSGHSFELILPPEEKRIVPLETWLGRLRGFPSKTVSGVKSIVVLPRGERIAPAREIPNPGGLFDYETRQMTLLDGTTDDFTLAHEFGHSEELGHPDIAIATVLALCLERRPLTAYSLKQPSEGYPEARGAMIERSFMRRFHPRLAQLVERLANADPWKIRSLTGVFGAFLFSLQIAGHPFRSNKEEAII